MSKKIKLDDELYAFENLNDRAQEAYEALEFTNKRLTELIDLKSVLQTAKDSYINNLKKEILASKAGFSIDEV